jgi:hypothetical protein
MIDRESQRHGRSHDRCAVDGHDPLADPPDCEDRRLRSI